MRKSLAPVLFAFLFFALPSRAQDYHVEVKQFSIEEGLSHREVHNVMQDSRGLMWVSTRYGLNRFDGHRFTWFTKEKHGLSSNNILKVVEDAQGWLWVLTAREGADNAVEFVDLMHVRSLELMPWAERRAPFSPSDIVEVVTNPEREIFFGMKKGGCWKLGINGAFTPLPLWEKKRFFPKFCSTTGTIWGFDTVATVANLMEINISSGEVLKKFQHVRGFEFVIAGEDASGQLWYSTSKDNEVSFFFIDLNGQQHQYDLTNIPIGDTSRKFAYGFPRLHINPHDLTFWWRAENVFAFSTPGGKPAALHKGEYPGLNYSRQVVFDKDGRGWVGCADGVYSVKLKPSRFRNLLAQPFQKADFSNNIECRGMAKAPNGEVYVNSYQGTFRLSPEGQILSENFIGVPKVEKWASMAMYVDPTGDTWFGWLRPARLDAKTGAIHIYQLPSHTIYEQPPDKKLLHVWGISRQPNGRMWFVGLNGHFGYLEPGADTVQLFENYGGFEELKKANVLDMQQGPDGKAWLAANTGLYLFDPERQKILQRYWTGGEGRFQLPHDNIHHVFQDGDSLLWIATGGGGLVQLAVGSRQSAVAGDEASQSPDSPSHQFTKSDGLASDLLYAVYPDEYGNLWLPSDYGIIQFNKASKSSRTFLPGDGLPHHEFNRISHHQAADGQLYFGCLNGVTTFHPRDFQDFSVKNEAPLVLLGMEQFDGEQNRLVNNLTQFMDYPEIVLHPGDRVLNLEFALLDYNAPERINYAYRIEGVDEEWTYLRENRISLSGLPYGDFVLKIKGQAATGVFSSEQLSIPLHVLKPLYLQTWFLLLAGLILLVAGPAFLKIRTRQLESQKRQLEAQVRQRTETIQRQNEQLAAQAGELRHLDEVKSRFFANVSHELRTPLTLLLGPISSVLKSVQLDNRSFTLLQKAQRSGNDLLQLINEILDLSKMESGRMELHEKPVRLYRLLRRWFSQFESYAQSQGLQLVFEYRASEELQVLLDAEKFEKVVNNFLSNAIKFTPPKADGRVTLRFEELDSKLLLNVTDTGQGIHPDDLPKVFDRFYQTNRPDAPAEGGTGIGLALVNEYAHLFGGKTWVDSELGKGSTFFFEFPKKLVAAGDWKPLATEETPEEIAPLPTLPATGREATSSPDRPTVLVVEDNPEMRDYLRLILEEKYKVVTAENGAVALQILNSQFSIFHLIISDLMMPVMDGYQLLEKLKSDDRWRHLPVVMLTARAGLRDKLNALRIGVDDYMTKPFEEEELLARVDNLLRHSEWRRQYLQETMEPTQGNEEEPNDASAYPSPTMSEEDSAWLEDLENTVKEKLGDFDFSLEQLAHEVASNRWSLYRRIKQLTGLTATQYLKEIRLNHARHLLEQNKYDAVKALSLDVGMKDIKYFSQEFKKRFGKLPSDYF